MLLCGVASSTGWLDWRRRQIVSSSLVRDDMLAVVVQAAWLLDCCTERNIAIDCLGWYVERYCTLANRCVHVVTVPPCSGVPVPAAPDGHSTFQANGCPGQGAQQDKHVWQVRPAPVSWDRRSCSMCELQPRDGIVHSGSISV
jgi:hypothetical protein